MEGNRPLELAWTAAPALLLAVFFVLTVRTMSSVNAESPSAMRVEVVGHQWWWEYRYPDLNLVTANELHLPVGVPPRLELTSKDVVHSIAFYSFLVWAHHMFAVGLGQIPDAFFEGGEHDHRDPDRHQGL